MHALACAPAKCFMAYRWPSQTYQMGNCYSWGGRWIFTPGSHMQCSIWFNMKVLHMNRWLDYVQVQTIELKQFLICLSMPYWPMVFLQGYVVIEEAKTRMYLFLWSCFVVSIMSVSCGVHQCLIPELNAFGWRLEGGLHMHGVHFLSD